MHLRRMCTVLLLDGMLYKSDLMCYLRLCFLINFLSGRSIVKDGAVKFPHCY